MYVKEFQQWLSEAEDGIFYRLIGGGQFGGAPITGQNEPRKGQTIAGVFATPNKDAINAMIEFCLDQGENEETGDAIRQEDMRVLVIQAAKTREPQPHEKAMHWEESDADEVMVEAGKITDVIEIKKWN